VSESSSRQTRGRSCFRPPLNLPMITLCLVDFGTCSPALDDFISAANSSDFFSGADSVVFGCPQKTHHHYHHHHLVVSRQCRKVKSILSHLAHRAALISNSVALSQTPIEAAGPRIPSQWSNGVPVYLLPCFPCQIALLTNRGTCA